MIELPEKLQNKSFRFIKLKKIPENKSKEELKKRKHPLEDDWPMTNNYKYNDPDFIEYLKTADGYGVACGFGKLAIVDCDNSKSAKKIMAALSETFTIQSAGHKSPHLYFIIKDLIDKIIMNDNNGVHHGEVQFTGAQALGPGSLHPNGKKYTVLKNIPVATITKKELITAIKPFIKEKEKVDPNDSGINLDISDIAKNIKGLKSDGKELCGPHPMHGSDNGRNIRINEETNHWHCFRCETGGDSISLIAMLEGIVPCELHKQGYWKNHKDEFKRTMAIAKKKYGYQTEEEKEIEEQVALTRELNPSELSELKNPALIYNVIREVQNSGVIGEEKSILTIINRIAMRCVLNITKTSGNLIILDDTGLGKDNVTEKLCDIMLVKDRTLFSATNITDKVLNYWHPGTPETSWTGRVIYLQDPEVETLKGQAFRVRASGKNENVTLDTERKVQHIKIVGKPILLVTSMKTVLDIELIRRWDGVHLDPSEELTKAIVDYQLKSAIGKADDIDVNENLRGALQNLPPVTVIIPFALELAKLLRSRKSIMRTMTSKFLDIIKASAALHQFQRERNQDGEVLATKEDLAYAIFVVNYCKVMAGQVLNRKQEQLIKYLISEGNEPVTFKQITTDNPGMSERWIYRQEEDLVERRILQMKKIFDPAAGKETKCYQVDTFLNVKIDIPKSLPGYFFNKLEKDVNESRKKYGLKKIKLYEE